MSLKALVYAYVLGGITFIPLLICAAIAWTIYTSVPVADPDPAKLERKRLEEQSNQEQDETPALPVEDRVRPRKAWLTVRRTFEEKESDGSYVNMMRAYLDSRSKDPKRSRPKDMWYVVLKGNVLYLYEDESMTECEAAIHLSTHHVIIYPEGLSDGELFTKRNAICLKPISHLDNQTKEFPSLTREMALEAEDVDKKVAELDVSDRRKEKERAKLEDIERMKAEARAEAFDDSIPWFIFVRSCVEMEDWYLALVHAAHYSDSSSTLEPVLPVFSPSDMNRLVATLDEQPDVIPMRWLNALIGRIFFSFYRTKNLESFIVGRLMRKLSKVKIPTFLQNVSVTEVSVGNTPPTFSKPMLKDLTKEGDAALEIRVMYRGEIRITVEATAIINLGQRFKTYTVKLVLAVVLRRLDGNLLVKVKRPPTNRIWYAFTHPPEMDLEVEPVVSDRQIKWSMICSTIESRLKEIINESIVMPNMDDIAFFESIQYMHRGGIWADASRETPSEMPSEQDGLIIDTNGDLPRKSRSTDALAETLTAAPTEPANEDNGLIEETVSAPSLVQDPNPTRRRSWFVSGMSGISESASENSKSTPSDPSQASDDDRGRTLNVDTSLRRATSVPASKSSSATNGPEVTEETSSQSKSNVDAEIPQETPSAHSRTRSLSSGTNILGAEQANSSRESLASRPTNASSILATLKQKADKQALSNTAKEAMRKWSANWNGFKREHMGGSNHGEDIQDGASTSNSLFRGRNYADIRASVVGRRDQESSGERHDASPSSQPIDIPSVNKDGEENRNIDGSSSSGSSKDLNPSSSASPHHSPKGPSLLRQEATRAPISPPKVTMDTNHDSESISLTPTDILSSPEPEVLPPPIKTQPSQGATMTIPGIHASHRGDVQSIGYVPPALSPPVLAEGKRTPTIQSVYRLFRSPTSNSSVLQQQQERGGTSQGSSTSNSPARSPAGSGGRSPAPESEPNDDVTPLTLTPSRSHSPIGKTNNPTPPPLPPRTVPTSHPRPTPPQLPPRRNDVGETAHVGDAEAGIAPSASEALRAIAQQDESKRRDIEASPELHPKAKASLRAKRTALGAKKISAPVVFHDEPEPMHEDTYGQPPSEAQSGESAHPGGSETVGAQPDEPPETTPLSEPADGPSKPKPPPLPPRRLSALSS